MPINTLTYCISGQQEVLPFHLLHLSLQLRLNLNHKPVLAHSQQKFIITIIIIIITTTTIENN